MKRCPKCGSANVQSIPPIFIVCKDCQSAKVAFLSESGLRAETFDLHMAKSRHATTGV